VLPRFGKHEAVHEPLRDDAPPAPANPSVALSGAWPKRLQETLSVVESGNELLLPQPRIGEREHPASGLSQGFVIGGL
jgi:hypothetical protein